MYPLNPIPHPLTRLSDRQLGPGGGRHTSDRAVLVRQLPRGTTFLTRHASVGTKGFLAGVEADADNTGWTELRYLPVSGKLCVKSSTHGILPGQKYILPRNSFS